MCWVTDVATHSQVLLSNCPAGLYSSWVEGFEPPVSFSIHDPPPIVKWTIFVPWTNLVNGSGFPSQTVPHANLHSCVTADVNFCTPSIQVTPGLNTQTPAQHGNVSAGASTFSADLLIGLNNATTRTTWTVLAHSRVFVHSNDSVPRLLQYDVAIGTQSTVYNDPYFDTFSDALTTALYVIAAVEMGLVALTVLFILVRITHPIIRASSPVFLLWMCFFALLGLSAVFPYGISPQTEATCNIVIWFAGVGFIGVFAPLLAKTFRLWRIFTNQSLRGLEISNGEVALYSLVLMLPEVIIFVVWSAADGPVPTKVPNADVSYQIQCKSDVNDLWYALISVYQLVVLFTGLVLAYVTRNLTTLFNESTFIGYSTVIMLGSAILAPVQFTNGNSPDSILALQCVQVLLYGLVIYLICWPKFIRILKGETPDISNIMLHTGKSSASRGSMGGSSIGDGEGVSSNISAAKMMKNGDLKPGARKAIRSLHATLDPLNSKVAAADPIEDSDLQPFISQFQQFQSRFS